MEAKKYASLRDLLMTLNPADIADAFAGISDQTLPLVFRLLPKAQAAETFVEMDPEQQATLIRGFSDSELKAVVDELYVDDAVDLVEEMPANVVSRILTQADPQTRKMINEILQYPEDSAGSVMTTEFVELRGKMTAQEAIAHIRAVGLDKETINTCYITDPGHHPPGRGVHPVSHFSQRNPDLREHHESPRGVGEHPGGSGDRGADVLQV